MYVKPFPARRLQSLKKEKKKSEYFFSSCGINLVVKKCNTAMFEQLMPEAVV